MAWLTVSVVLAGVVALVVLLDAEIATGNGNEPNRMIRFRSDAKPTHSSEMTGSEPASGPLAALDAFPRTPGVHGSRFRDVHLQPHDRDPLPPLDDVR
jgi:hypothetical protein